MNTFDIESITKAFSCLLFNQAESIPEPVVNQNNADDSVSDISDDVSEFSEIASYISEQDIIPVKKTEIQRKTIVVDDDGYCSYRPVEEITYERTGLNEYVKDNIQQLMEQYDLPKEPFLEAIDCNVLDYCDKMDLRNNVEAFFNQEQCRPSGLTYNYFDVEWNGWSCEIFKTIPQTIQLQSVNAVQGSICMETGDCYEFEPSISTVSDSESDSNISQQIFTEIQVSAIVQKTTCEMQKNYNGYCHDHKRKFCCPVCQRGAESLTQVPLEESKTLPNNLVDLQYHQKHITISQKTDDTCVKAAKIQHESISIRNYSVYLPRDYNNYPIKQSVQWQEQPIHAYQYSDSEAPISYGNIRRQEKQITMKAIIDNNLRFNAPDAYYCVALDIETYNDSDWHKVPQKDNQFSKIGMCCLSIRFVGGSSNDIKRKCFLYDLNYNVACPGIEVIRFATEQEMAISVLNELVALRNQGFPVFVYTFNGSASLYGSEPGYDIPFIGARAQICQPFTTQVLRMESEINAQGIECLVAKSKMITGIEGVQGVYFVDIQQRLASLLSQDDKNAMDGMSLDSCLQLYKIPQKKAHNYVDIQRRLSQGSCDISDIVEYCSYDCDALFSLDSAANILGLYLSMQNQLQLPLSWALYRTPAKQLELYLMREYTKNGYAVTYYSSGEVFEKYQGAYCWTDPAAMCMKIKDTITPDFASLYPNSQRSINGCLTTFLSQPTKDCVTVPIITIDPATDDVTVEKEYYYSRENGVMPSLITQLFDKRTSVKGKMKQFTPGSIAHGALNVQQLALKLCLNTLYGLLGNSKSPLFWRPLAESITSYGRQAILCAKQVFVAQGSRFLAADTDSCMCTIPDSISDYNGIQMLMKSANLMIQERMRSQFLSMEIEEIVSQVHFSAGIKSYLALHATGSDFVNWKRGVPVQVPKCKIRGVPWAKTHKCYRLTIKEHFERYLQCDLSAKEYFDTVRCDLEREISTAVEQQCLQTLQKYSERVKLSGKNVLVKHLRGQYYNYVENQDHCQVILLAGSGPKTERKIPINAVNDLKAWPQIDRTALLYNALSTLAKLLLTKQEAKELPTAFKIHMETLQQQLNDDEILVRIVKPGSTAANYIAKWARGDVSKMLHGMRKKGYAVHEKTQGMVRLFFDVEHSSHTICEIIAIIQDELRICLGNVPRCSYLSSKVSENDIRYHIFTDISVRWTFAKVIATTILRKHQGIGIDIGVYNEISELRLPMSLKVTKDGALKDCFYACAWENVSQFLITPQEQYPFVETPLHLIQEPIIDVAYRGQRQNDVKQGDIKLVQAFIDAQKLPFSIEFEGKRIKLIRKSPSMCPCCNVTHDSIDAYVTAREKRLYFNCFRQNQYQGSSVLISDIQEEQKAVEKQIERTKLLQKMIDDAPLNNLIRGSMRCSTQYLDLDITEQLQQNPLLAVKSSLGTGKTVSVQQFLTKCIENVLIVSHRISYTANLQQRYNGFTTYNEQKGSLSLIEHQRIICQVESLGRIQHVDGCVLILDEIESILSQLNGGVAKQQNAVQSFLWILSRASKIIVMDGFLQNSTVEMLQYVRNATFHVYQNVIQPYEGHKILLKPYKLSMELQILDDIKNALERGENICSMITSNRLATSIATKIQELGYETRLYTGDSLTEFAGERMIAIKERDFADVNTSFKARFVCWTSTLTAGVDVNIEHFTKFIHVFVPETCTAQQFVQGLGRVRRYSQQEHTIYYQHKRSEDYPQTPNELVMDIYSELCGAHTEYQLQCWLESRGQSMRYFRTPLLLAQLKEMGFHLTQTDETVTKGRVSCEKGNILSVKVTEEDVNEYNLLLENHQRAHTTPLTAQQYEKIHFLKAIGFDPIRDYSKEEYIRLNSGYGQLKQLHSFNKLTQNDHQSLHSLLQLDIENRKSGMSGSKKIHIATIKRIADALNLSKQLNHLLKDGTTFTKNDMPQSMRSDNRALKKINEAAALNGLIVSAKLDKIIDGKSHYTYNVKQILQ